jgi:dipeptidyl aminopeptidase/acylaminoacyl peptidase
VTEIDWPGVRVHGVVRAGATDSTVLAYGERDGATVFAILAGWAPEEPQELPHSVPGRLRSVAGRSETPIAVSADGRQGVVWVAGEPRFLDLPLGPDGAPPVRTWATAGDDDGRFMAAYDSPEGLRLELVRDADTWRAEQFTDDAPLRVVETPGQLLVHGDLDDVRIESTAAFEVVTGPVGDAADGPSQLWTRPYQGYGEQPWARLTAEEGDIREVLDVEGRNSNPAILARTDAGMTLMWMMDGYLSPDPVEGLRLDPAHPVALLAPGAQNIVYAVQSPDGPEFRFGTPAIEWDTAIGTEHAVPLPPGRLIAAACGPDEDWTDFGFAVVDHRLHAVPLVGVPH